MPKIVDDRDQEIGWLHVPAICGDYCDLCGDCLACYGEDECQGGGHTWSISRDEAAERSRVTGVAPTWSTRRGGT